MVPPALLLVVLAATALIGVASLAALAAAKLRWQIRTRRDARFRAELRELTLALAAGEIPPAAPVSGRRREVALEMMIDTVARLRGRNRVAAQLWFEQNGFVDEALRELRSRHGWRRARATYRLGRFGSPRTEPYLFALLKDPRYEVRDASARALGRIGSPDAVGPLLDAAERRRVAPGLASGALLEMPAECDRALEASLAGRGTSTRRMVVQAIGLRGRAGGNALIDGLRDAEPGVRRDSALALARLGEAPDEAEFELRRLARDELPWVRAAAGTALGALLADRAATTLVALCGDEDFWVGYRAAEALIGLDSGPEHGWRVLCGRGDQPHEQRARERCLEVMEHGGHIETRLEQAIAEDGRGLDELLDALERVGSRAWSGLQKS